MNVTRMPSLKHYYWSNVSGYQDNNNNSYNNNSTLRYAHIFDKLDRHDVEMMPGYGMML